MLYEVITEEVGRIVGFQGAGRHQQGFGADVISAIRENLRRRKLHMHIFGKAPGDRNNFV